MRDQRVDECAVGITGCGMDDQPRGLVDNNQMCILKTNVERQRLRNRRRILHIREEHDKILVRSHFLRGIARRAAVLHDAAFFDQPLQPCPRQFRKVIC